ncbi:hypothetical protein BC629DRAFT_1523750 [Irpex lacteus]|nr:hypothetical protein BC629DRAFT_1523750 [Irpex lacteus]
MVVHGRTSPRCSPIIMFISAFGWYTTQLLPCLCRQTPVRHAGLPHNPPPFFSRSQGQGLIIFIVLGSICTESSSTCGRTRPCHRSRFSWPPHRKNMCFRRHRMSSCMSSRNIEKHISIQMFYRRGDAMRLLRRTTQHSTTPSHRAKTDRLQYSIQLSRFAIDTTKQSMSRLTLVEPLE